MYALDMNKFVTTRQSAAHAARRGQVDSVAVKTARAVTRRANGLHIGPHEVALAKLFDAAGIEYSQQTVCGFYNLDFTLAKYPIAVEVVSGSGNLRQSAGRKNRMKRILNEWHLIEIRLDKSRVISAAVIDQVIAYCEITRSYKPPCSKYRVVRADGKVIALRGKGIEIYAEVS